MSISKEQYKFLNVIDSKSIGFDDLISEKRIYDDAKYHNLILNLYIDKYFKISKHYFKCVLNQQLFQSLDNLKRTRLFDAFKRIGYNQYILTQKGIEAIADFELNLEDSNIKNESLRISKQALEEAKIKQIRSPLTVIGFNF